MADTESYDQPMASAGFYPRFAEARLIEALADSPVVVLHGPRQSGKTTLARLVGERREYAYVTFDDDVARQAADVDPVGFVGGLPPRVILDEVQRVPGLFTALKAAVDRRREPGRFLLTGSANVLLVPRLADSLAGRMEILRLLNGCVGCDAAFDQAREARPQNGEARTSSSRATLDRHAVVRFVSEMTTSVRRARHHYSYEEYLAYERDSAMKHEFDDGEIFAIAGGSPPSQRARLARQRGARECAQTWLHRVSVGSASASPCDRQSDVSGCVDGVRAGRTGPR